MTALLHAQLAHLFAAEASAVRDDRGEWNRLLVLSERHTDAALDAGWDGDDCWAPAAEEAS